MVTTKLFTRNFTFLILGQISSLFGNNILKLALSMYILETTGSAAVFAALLSVSTIPVILLSPFGGVLADRANRRNIMVGLDFISGITVVMTMIFFDESNAIPIIGTVLVILSVLGAFESPTVQACVPQMQTGENIVKANAVISQISAISALVSPILGSALYVAFGLNQIMLVCGICFLFTAFLECFIQLEYIKKQVRGGIWSVVRADFKEGIHFITRKQKGILAMLFLAAGLNFLMVGIGVIGLPFMVRTVLGLSAKFYGASESIMGVAAIAGSVLAGLLVTRLKTQKLYWMLIGLGIAIFPIAIVFLFSGQELMKYAVITAALFVMQILSSLFSIFAFSVIQRKTPNELLGKVMSYVVTISLCAQPLGHLFYGFIFDQFSSFLFWIFMLTGVVCCFIGILSKKTLFELDRENT